MASVNTDNDPFNSLEEDSFVILGRSPSSDVWESSIDDNATQSNLMEEAKNILTNELQTLGVSLQSSVVENQDQALPNFQSSHFSQSIEEKSVENIKPVKTNNDKLIMNQSVVLPDIPAEIQNVLTNTTVMNLPRSVSIPSLSQGDFVSEELQRKIEDLVNENMHLKKTLSQNNSCMQLQYEKISNWQKEVERIFELHKTKLIEAKAYIATLKKDYAALVSEIDSLNAMNAGKSNNTETGSYEKTDKELMTIQLAAANRRVTDLLRQLHLGTIEEHEKTAAEQRRADAMEQEIRNKEQLLNYSTKTIEDLQSKVKDYSKIIEKLTAVIPGNPCKFVDAELPSLQIMDPFERAELQRQVLSAINPCEKLEEIETELYRARNARDDACQLNKELDCKIHYLEEQVELKEKALSDAVCKYELRIEELENERERNRSNFYELDEKFRSASRELKKVTDENKNMTSESLLTSMKQEIVDLKDLNKKYMDSNKDLNQIADQHKDLCEKFSLLEKENAELKEKIPNSDSNLDAALQAQLALYKSDFETERKLKQQYKEDNSKLTADLQLIHGRNQQLQDEVEHYRQRLQDMGIPVLRPEHHEPTPRYPFICPICNQNFRTYINVQNHVDQAH